MTPEALARLSAIYDQAATHDEAERRDWLARLAEEDAALAPGLRAMLAGARRETADLLDRGLAFEPAQGPMAGFAAGDDVGPYRLLRRLGEGGMGEVWLAGVMLARLHDRAGRTDEARRAAREAWSQAVATLDPGHPALAEVRAWC